MQPSSTRSTSRLAAFALLGLAACSSSVTATPDAGPDAPVTDTPITDTPITDAPVMDTPVTDAPVTDTPVTDTPAMDTPVSDAPLFDRVMSDAPLDVPAPDLPIGDTPAPDVPAPDVPAPDVPTPDLPPSDGGSSCSPTGALDLLFVIDNSNSMAENQATVAAQFGSLLDGLIRADATSTPLRDVHIGVVSADLGTPGVVVPSCANSDTGDDGLLNPIRNGFALRAHQPWTTAPDGRRPARCTMDPTQYPSFLSYTSATSDTAAFREDFVCNAYLSIGGCGLEQQLESAYRALVIRNPREQVGNRDPNAGFVRNDAVLGVLFVTDEEDGSTRDCRYAEAGQPCNDAIAVFDFLSMSWASSDLNLRFYMYTPGGPQDPTWSLDRYMDPARPARGFTSLKPGRPDLVVVGAIAGVPLAQPRRADGSTDWDALLGRSADGSDGYVAMSAEGPVSMRQRNMDPMCSTRVVPACRRQGSSPTTSCSATDQYFAWPSRRIAQVVRRFDDRYGNGVLGSICASSYAETMAGFASRVRRRICRP
ncbi:MAG: hypothetical protein U0326_21595 [Polyangiales bacterium]